MKIAITGKMCSGKTTLSNYICSQEPRFKIFSFGKKVKEVASDLFKMDPNFKDRSLLTLVGQKMREINSEVWINYVIDQTMDQEFCLIDDLRYQNEYDVLVKNGFKIIQMNISPTLQGERIRELYPDNYKDHLLNRNHLSELNEFTDSPDLIIDSGMDESYITNMIRLLLKDDQ